MDAKTTTKKRWDAVWLSGRYEWPAATIGGIVSSLGQLSPDERSKFLGALHPETRGLYVELLGSLKIF